MERLRVHPVPTQRQVVISALDKQHSKIPVEALLALRGFDLTLPYREEPWDQEGATLYVQDIPQE